MIELGLFTKDQSFMEIGVILADVHITYLAPIYFGEHIKVGVHVSKLGNKSMTWAQNIVDAKTGKELAKGEVVMVTYDYDRRKDDQYSARLAREDKTVRRFVGSSIPSDIWSVSNLAAALPGL